jgi:hypothetical protein
VKIHLFIFGGLAIIATAMAQPAPGEDPLSKLDAGQIDRAIESLRTKHVNGATLNETELDRATLRGLLEGLQPGAALAGSATSASEVSPFRSEVLDGRAGYVRLGTLRTECLTELDAAMEDFRARQVQGVVLDLRATPESQNFEIAAEVASRFVPTGRELFVLRGPGLPEPRAFKSSGAAPYRGPLIVIIDETTGGAAEVLAATLRWNAKALLVGTRSSGRTIMTESTDLGGDQRLELATAEALIGGQSVYPRGLRPDVEIDQDPRVREAVLAGALERGAAVYLYEEERAQTNEAALVAGTIPELEADETTPSLIDRPLQRAVDLVIALQLFAPKR